MNWGLITNEWRLKLLAVGLAILMLGAVAFSQNPPTSDHRTIPLNYTTPPNIVLINPPSKIDVTITGLADGIKQVNSNNLIASVDASRALPGDAVKLNVLATTTGSISGVTVIQPPPIAVTVDTYQAKQIPLTVNAPTAAGWNVTKAVALCPTTPCTSVTFSGPVNWETNLTATATFPSVIGQDTSGCTALACTKEALNQPVLLRNSSGTVDLSAVRTVPVSTLDISAVNLHVEAAAGVTSSTVPLVVAAPSAPPPQGYSITGVTVSPVTIVVTGDPAVLGHIQRITLPPQDLSNSTSTATFAVQIPYPNRTSGSVSVATVTYSISRNPQVSPSP
ncbi:MAG TPA: CdaR family protein [Candidatus Dormibacteraeota bacterium]|nr:CdaR family protein [Candidatus Dormibacteraeota bacterium]